MKSVGNCNCGRGAVFSSWGAALAAHGLHFRRPSSAWQPFTGQRRGACVAMPLLSMYINNKAGGLIYHKDFAPHSAKLDVNDHLRLASTLSGLALILKEMSPVKGSSNMLDLECDSFVLQSFDTPTGLKFFITADPDSRHLDAVLKEVYVLYSDFVLKNPFYELDMPIHCDKFDQKLLKLAEDYNRRG